MGSPSIACIGVIGKLNNPLHVSVFPPHEDSHLKFTLFLNSSLDIFTIRQQHVSVDQDLGLLHAFDERYAAYGWLTNTGIKFVVIVDAIGKNALGYAEDETTNMPLPGVQEADLKPVFRSLQTAYIRLLQNPFHSPTKEPMAKESQLLKKSVSAQSMLRFVEEIHHVALGWSSGKLV